MGDPVEHRLLETIATAPADTHARQVYADWLEQHGYETRATFLRLDAIDDTPMGEIASAARPLDAAWRREVSRTPIARCVTFAFACRKRWADLRRRDPGRTDAETRRYCEECGKDVFYVATVAEAEAQARAGRCIAIDPAVARGDLERAYDHLAKPEREVAMMLGAPMRDPAPPKRGVLAKIRGWFTR